jgi:hypothetical protein
MSPTVPLVASWATLISLLLSFVLPLVVGLVTKASWSGGLKAVLLLALQAITQFLVSWQAADAGHLPFDWRGWLLAVGLGFVVSVASHFGLWKPTGVAASAQATGVADYSPPRRN